MRKVAINTKNQINQPMLCINNCAFHVLVNATLTYNRTNSVIIKNAIILNIMHNIFNLLDREVVICII